MGYWKNMMLREDDQGWSYLDADLHVCAECFDDEAIRGFIENSASKLACSYCGQSADEPIAAPMNSVLEVIGSAVAYGYTDPANSLPREDGDWVFGESIMDIDEVLEELGWPTQKDNVAEDIREAFSGRQWVVKNFFGLSEDDQLQYGWGDFVAAVKHRTRYLFMLPGEENAELGLDEIPPHKMLDEIGKVVIDVELVREMKAGTQLFRARIHNPNESYSTASELGTVPKEKAVYPNRMSPAGIPMFYGATDETTAVAETYIPKPGRQAAATIAKFQTARDLQVLDLTDLPPMPSPFDEATRHLRPAIAFLEKFVEDLTQSIVKNGCEHIEYVPTQIVTEYFRHVFKRLSGERVDGIVYRSSRNGGICCVLFFEAHHCCDAIAGWESSEENWLGLAGVTRKDL